LFSSVTSLILQVLFCIVSVYSVSTPSMNLTEFRWYVFLPWPLVILAMDELCKMHDRSHRDFNHKKARQHFDTVLGSVPSRGESVERVSECGSDRDAVLSVLSRRMHSPK
jgi:hypothetical protein